MIKNIAQGGKVIQRVEDAKRQARDLVRLQAPARAAAAQRERESDPTDTEGRGHGGGSSVVDKP